MPTDMHSLNDHEEIVLDLRPHWTVLSPVVPPALGGVMVGLVFTVVLPLFWWAGLLIALIGVLPLAANVVRWRMTCYLVTSDRAITQNGVLTRVLTEVPLDRVMNVSFKQSMLQRCFGCGDLLVESAGEHGSLHMRDIPNPLEVEETIYRQTEIYTQRGPKRMDDEERNLAASRVHTRARTFPAPDNSLSDEDASPSCQRAIEDLKRCCELRDAGMLDDAELAHAKRRLLDRM